MLNVEVLLRENMEDFFKKEPCFPFQHSQWAEGLSLFSSLVFQHKSTTHWWHNLT